MSQLGWLALPALIAVSASHASSPRAQAEILHYGFDEATGLTVKNKARGALAGPATGKIVSTNDRQRHDTGRLIKALHSLDKYDYKNNVVKSWNYVETGWTKKVEGSFSVGFFYRVGLSYGGLGAFYLFGGNDGFRCFTDGRIGSGLSVAGWGGGYLDLRQDMRREGTSKWVHVVLVVDDKTRTAVWYVDGEEKSRERIFTKPILKARTSFRIGAHDRLRSTSPWHLDEFRLVARALTPLEIKSWALLSTSFGSGCNAAQLGPHDASPPKLGTNKFALRVRSTPKAVSLIGVGFSRTKFGAIPLPFALDKAFGKAWKDCSLLASFDLMILNVLGDDGIGYKALALPNDQRLAGLTLYAQALVFGKATTARAASNGWLFSLVD